MDYTIYAFGSGEVLSKIFNGMAILLANDSAYFTPALQLSMAIGGLWAATRALYGTNIGIFAKDWFIPSFMALNFLFVPKATVNIIDLVDDRQVFARVDNIPVGLALVASFPSSMFYHLTLLVEDALSDPMAPNVSRYSKTGPMFAAQLMNASKHLRVTDPILKQNLKHFVRRCYVLPYLKTNITPGALAAQNAPSIIDFVETNPHPGLGIYWRSAGGDSTFLHCADCIDRLRVALDPAIEEGMFQLSSIVAPFGTKTQEDLLLLEGYLKDAWTEMSSLASSAHDIVGQQMVINATLEANDDKKESLNMSRLNPELTSYSATRAWEGQKQGWLINGALAARYLPTLQGGLLGLLLMMFAFVVPMTLIPGGMGVLGSWVKMVFWVNSWPLFFALLNCLGNMWLARYAQAEGLTIATQEGIADHAFNAYTIVQGLSWGVPLLSWALINRGGYALVQSISGMTANLGQSMGQNIADNTQSFDNQSMHNIQQHSYSVAQQTMSPSFLAGTRVSDGQLDMTFDTSGGMTTNQMSSNLRDSVMNSQSLSEGVTSTKADDLASQENIMTEAGKNYSQSFSKFADFSDQIGKSNNYSDTVSAQEQVGIDHSTQRLMQAAQKISDQSSMSNSTSADGSVGASVRVGIPELLKSISPISISGDLGEKLSTSSQDSNTLQKFKEQGITEQDLRNFSKGSQYVKSGQMTFGDESAQRSADGWRSSMDKVDQASDKFSASLSHSQRVSEIDQWNQSSGGTVNSNITDPVLEKVAKERFGGDKAAATRWAASHSSEWKAEGQNYIKSSINDTADWMDRSGRTSFTESEMSARFQGYSSSLKSSSPMNLTPTSPPKENSGFFGSHADGSFIDNYSGSLSKGQVESKREESGLGENFRAEMANKQNVLEAQVIGHQAASKPSNSIQEQGKELGDKYDERFNQSKFARQAQNVFEGTAQARPGSEGESLPPSVTSSPELQSKENSGLFGGENSVSTRFASFTKSSVPQGPYSEESFSPSVTSTPEVQPKETSGLFGSNSVGSFIDNSSGSPSRGQGESKREEFGRGESFRSEVLNKQNTFEGQGTGYQLAPVSTQSSQSQGSDLGTKYDAPMNQSQFGHQSHNSFGGRTQAIPGAEGGRFSPSVTSTPEVQPKENSGLSGSNSVGSFIDNSSGSQGTSNGESLISSVDAPTSKGPQQSIKRALTERSPRISNAQQKILNQRGLEQKNRGASNEIRRKK